MSFQSYVALYLSVLYFFIFFRSCVTLHSFLINITQRQIDLDHLDAPDLINVAIQFSLQYLSGRVDPTASDAARAAAAHRTMRDRPPRIDGRTA